MTSRDRCALHLLRVFAASMTRYHHGNNDIMLLTFGRSVDRPQCRWNSNTLLVTRWFIGWSHSLKKPFSISNENLPYCCIVTKCLNYKINHIFKFNKTAFSEAQFMRANFTWHLVLHTWHLRPYMFRITPSNSIWSHFSSDLVSWSEREYCRNCCLVL